MSEPPFEPEAPVSQFGAFLAARHRANLERSAENMTAASMAAHQQDHAHVTSGQAGIFGAGVTGHQQAADVAARPARVGDGSGNGRDLEAWGGFDWESHGAGASGPVPARVYASQLGQQSQGEMVSPLLRHLRGEQ
jgi:hypothetical protein